jgi:hypothetical protein
MILNSVSGIVGEDHYMRQQFEEGDKTGIEIPIEAQEKRHK